jgi:myosin heavy subunit
VAKQQLSVPPSVGSAQKVNTNVNRPLTPASLSKSPSNINTIHVPSVGMAIEVPSVHLATPPTTNPAIPVTSTSRQFASPSAGDSTATSSKRSRGEGSSDSGSGTPNSSRTKVARLAKPTPINAVLPNDILNEKSSDPHFHGLLLELAKYHETVLETRDSATSANENYVLEIAKKQGINKVLQDEKVELEKEKVELSKIKVELESGKVELEKEKRELALERDTAVVLARDNAELSTQVNSLKVEKLEAITKTMLDEKAELEKVNQGLVVERDAAAMLAREKESELQIRVANLEVKLTSTKDALETARARLKEEEELAREVSRAEKEMEKKREKVQEEAREVEKQREVENNAMNVKLQEENGIMQNQMKDLQTRLEEYERAKRITKTTMAERLVEIENLRSQYNSAVRSANTSRLERNNAQDALDSAKGNESQISDKLEEKIAALDAANATIQKLQVENGRLIQKESAIQVAVKPKLVNLQANHQQIEADKKRLETEVQQAKQRIVELEGRVQVSDASLVDHNNVEKELVAARILAANYKEQRDEARKNWQESEKAKTDIRRNWNVKSAEMSRLHREIRRLKGEKPRISEGIRADSGSVGEVEGLIDLSMEED